ncbi:MAG TPA: hypothetical protein VNK04_11225 [Gemmataceae bacterium]|nr:hypothetical protein [Gemmataceae bacterium]
MSGRYSPAAFAGQLPALTALEQAFGAFGNALLAAPAGAARDALAVQAGDRFRNALIGTARGRLALFNVRSDSFTESLQRQTLARAYHDGPRITILSTQVVSPPGAAPTVTFSVDLRKDDVRVVVSPGNAAGAAVGLNVARGFVESTLEGTVFGAVPTDSGVVVPVTAAAVFQAAAAQNVALAFLTPATVAAVDTLAVPAAAKALITDALARGKMVLAPVTPVTVGGAPRTGWYEMDPVTGETIGVLESGQHQALWEYSGLVSVNNQNTQGELFAAGAIAGLGIRSFASLATFLAGVAVNAANPDNVILAIKQIINTLVNTGQLAYMLATAPPAFSAGFLYGMWFSAQYSTDPPAGGPLRSPDAVLLPPDPNRATTTLPVAAGLGGGAVSGTLAAPDVWAAGAITATWQTGAVTSLRATGLSAGSAVVTDAAGNLVGSGAVSLAADAPVSLAVGGTTRFDVAGTGELAVYAPAAAGLGVAGDWAGYTAGLSGAVTIRLTTDGLTLNGTRLPAGTYTLTTASASVSGSGATASPNFDDEVSLTLSGSVVSFGPATGGLTVGSVAVDPGSGVTLAGYAGTVTVTAGGAADSVAFRGTAAHVLRVAGGPALAADQNTPVGFTPDVRTSLAGTYALTAEAPAGWSVGIDGTGRVTVTPAPGVQGGTYPVRVVVRSAGNPGLVAQATVDVTVTPTAPGVSLAVQPDALFTVPYNGAQVPTAFRASVRNLGPAVDTFNLSVTGVPPGFTLQTSANSVTVPAGQTGIVGLYLVPNGGPLPAPGTHLTFTVTATSTTDGSITATQNVDFVMPEVHGVTVIANPVTVNTTPGNGVEATVTVTAVGNVAEAITLTATSSAGLGVSGLPQTVTLNPGQSATFPVQLTPDAATPLNSTLAATITATYGPSGTPLTQAVLVPVRVVVPGADAVANAAVAAQQLGNPDLSNRLNDLAAALTNLVQDPTSDVYKSQSLAEIDAVLGLLGSDPFQNAFVADLTAARDQLAAADTPAEVQAAVRQVGDALQILATTLADEVAHGFTFVLSPNTAVALPGAPATFDLVVTNTGTQATTYDFTVSGLPTNVTAGFNVPSLTLNPGESSTGGNRVYLSLTETGSALFATGFTVTVTARGAAEITRTATGTLTVRDAFVRVTSVTPAPSFTEPGGRVAISARVLNAVNAPQTARASFVVHNAAGTVVFTSTPVPIDLTVQTSLATVDLGTFDTTGLPRGSYTIAVTLTDAAGNLIPGATGTGSLLVGLPVTGTLTVSPTSLPQGDGTVTNTLTLTAQTTLAPPFTLVGQTATTAVSSTIVIRGTTAYVAGSNGVDIVNVADPAAPVRVSTFAQDLIVQGGYTVVRELPEDRIMVASTTTFNANGTRVLVYSVADPLNPALLSNTLIPEAFMSDFLVSGSLGLLTTHGVFLFGSESAGDAFAQFGDVTALDLGAASGPVVTDLLFGTRNPPFTGDNQVTGGEVVDADTAYFTSTTLSGNNFTDGVGRLLVVNYADPANLVLTREVQVAGTVQLFEIAVEGNLALAVGSTGGGQDPWNNVDSDPSNDSGTLGNLTLTTLDVTDRDNPVVLSTVVTAAVFPRGTQPSSKLSVVPVGGGRFAVSLGIVAGNPVIFLVDATNPQDVVASALRVNTVVSEMAVVNGRLYTTSADGLLVYDIGQVDTVPVTASVQVPKGTGVSVVADSFNIPPTRVVPGPDFDTLMWDRRLAFGLTAETITWRTTVNDLAPGEARAVTLGRTVNFTVGGSPGSFGLPPTSVAAVHVISLDPPARTVQPAAAASFTVTLTNPTAAQVTYTLSVRGVPAGWVSLPPSVVVGPNGSATVTLRLTPEVFATLADYGFVVAAQGNNGAAGTVQGTLTVAGQPASRPDPEAHGVVLALTPAQATAGQGTSAAFVVRVTNTGSALDTFSLSANLPPGVTAVFEQDAVEVPPGASNFREVFLRLTPQPGTAPGSYSFHVTAVSTTRTSTTDTTDGTLAVLGSGVDVMLSPPSGAPGSTYQLTVTNTGQVADTFDLTLGGSAGLAATLGSNFVSLAPGASQVIPVSVGAINFALPGPLDLGAVATSRGNPGVRDAALAAVNIAAAQGMTARFDPASRTLSAPGTASFLLLVQNTGNTEDAYTVSITGSSGPVTVHLRGLDGQPAQSIPIFRLPGLSTGAILFEADLTTLGQGTFTIQVQSLSNGAIAATAAATVSAGQAPVEPMDCRDRYGSLATPGRGNVWARLRRGRLIIRGDQLANAIDVVAEAAGAVVVTGVDDTLVNRQRGPQRFAGVRRIDIRMRKGNDSVLLTRSAATVLNVRGLTVRMQRGTDELIFCDTDVHGQVLALAGPGPDTVVMADSIFHQQVVAFPRQGRDTIRIETGGDPAGPGTEFLGPVDLRSGPGADRIVIGAAGEAGNAAQFRGRTLIRGGLGRDMLDAGLQVTPNGHGNTFGRLEVRNIERYDS